MPKKSENIEEVMNKLSELTAHLTEEQNLQLQKNIITQDFKKNDIIYREGDRPRYMLCQER